MADKKKTKGRRVTVEATHKELMQRSNLAGWTPRKVQVAQEMADGGSMQNLADFCETVFNDDRVSGVLSTRTHGLLGLPVDFKGGSEQARDALQGSDNDDLNDYRPGEWSTMHDESELAKLLSWGITLGVGLAQRIELPRVVGRPHKYKLKTWHPRWLQYNYQLLNSSHWRVTTRESGLVPVVPGDGEWILFTPYGEYRPWASGLINALAFPWLLKHFALEDRANYSEMLGNPIWVGTTGAGSTQKQRDAFLSQLRGAGKNTRLVLPDGWDLQLREASGKSYEIYEGQVTWADQAMTITLAGQTVTTEGMSGFSSGNIHDAIKQDLIRFDAERLSTCLRAQSLEQWALTNYGQRKAAPWPQWQTKPPTDMNEAATGLGSLGDAIAKLNSSLSQYGIKVDAAKMVADFNVPVLNIPQQPTVSPPPKVFNRKKPRG